MTYYVVLDPHAIDPRDKDVIKNPHKAKPICGFRYNGVRFEMRPLKNTRFVIASEAKQPPTM
jgi:hypothetical protein